MKIQRPKEIRRTTLGEFLAHGKGDTPGIYVIACYPSLGCVYVGKTCRSVNLRMREHLSSESKHERLGKFLRQIMSDACGFGIDVLVPPDDCNQDDWLRESEIALIEYFRPLLNQQHATMLLTTRQ